MRKLAVIRIRILTGVFLLIALILISRSYYIQIHQHELYVDKATKQYVHTVEDVFDRGNIYFTTKDGELVSGAAVQAGYVLAVDPTQITDAKSTCSTISQLVTVDVELCEIRSTLPERTYVELLGQVRTEDAEKLDKLDLDGVYLYRTQWRYYPGDDLSARTVGFTAYSGEEGVQPVGRYGLERSYDEVLTRDQDKLSVNFFAEIFGNLTSNNEEEVFGKSGDVVTSIEPTVARMLARELQSAQERWDSRLTGGIIMNPKTGEIYALDAVPTYNLNDRKNATIEEFRNPLVEDVYEFGSIIKALTVAAGLDSKAVAPSTTYYDSGKLTLDGFTIGNFDGKGRGTVNMQQVLNQSLNTGVAFIVRTMGKTAFRDYFMKLQIGSESGIDLPNEAYGLIENLNSPRDIEYATASFGQGIALTPIAATRALATLGNGGLLVTPHLATKLVYEDGTEKPISYPEGTRVFSADTSESISRMLTGVVDDALRGGRVKIENYTVAAKTGTAQISAPGGGYYDDRYLHSFFGYFPSYDPEFIIFLYTIEPKGVQYASETLTDSFMNITKFLINYYSIPPDR